MHTTAEASISRQAWHITFTCFSCTYPWLARIFIIIFTIDVINNINIISIIIIMILIIFIIFVNVIVVVIIILVLLIHPPCAQLEQR